MPEPLIQGSAYQLLKVLGETWNADNAQTFVTLGGAKALSSFTPHEAAVILGSLSKVIQVRSSRYWVAHPEELEKFLEGLNQIPGEARVTPAFPYTLSEPFHVVVPHGKKTVKGLVKAGAYDYANPDITDANFPNVREADDEFDILLAHFDREMQSDDVERLLRADGLEVVGMADLLALGAKYPDLQREFLILALGQSWQDPNLDVLVGVLNRYWSDPMDRYVSLHDLARRWDRDCRFAVRRRPALKTA